MVVYDVIGFMDVWQTFVYTLGRCLVETG